MHTGCENYEGRLIRYADNDLSAADAARVAAHLSGCPACTESLARLTAIHSLLVGLAPSDSDKVEASRERVFRRFRVRAASPARRFPWRLAAPMLAAAAAALLLIAWPTLSAREPLPTEAERALLFDLHDAHSALHERIVAEEVPS